MVRKIHPKFFGKIINGKATLNPSDKKYYDGYVSTFMEDQEIEITVKNKFKRRTAGKYDEETNFNGYYWGVIITMLMDEIPDQFTKREMHQWLQVSVGNSKMIRGNIEIPKGTSEMSGGEFAEYCSQCRIFCSKPGNICDKGMYIPEPHEAEYNDE